MKKIIRLTESELHNIVKESVRSILLERASSLLYHFLEFIRFEEMVRTDSFTPSDIESEWHDGRKTMSFSRTKSFREGWPVVMYSGEDGKGDDWCAIRLTIDGDLINRKPNFKVDGKQYNMSVKPFDWAYKEYNNGDPFTFADEHDGIFANNGKEWMMQSDADTVTYLPINFGKKTRPNYISAIGDKQGHPYSQAEDRLTTFANKIPNASQYIIRVDILLLPYNFNEDNLEERTELYNIITNSQLSDKIHIYDKLREIEMNGREINPKILLQNTANNYKNPTPWDRWKVKQDF
jgi:hypothetical protein